jgi:hypothetical protein
VTVTHSGDAVGASAEMLHMQILDAEIGVFLRGEIAVYRGTLAAHDDFDSGAVDIPSVIPLGPARAHFHSDGELFVWSACSGNGLWIREYQGATASTEVSFVSSRFSPVSTATCVGCIPDFFGKPATADWQNASAGSLQQGFNIVLHVISSASYRFVSPCDLTWDDLVFPQGPLASFVRIGNEMVNHTQGSIVAKQPTGKGQCDGRQVPYTIDEFVELGDVANYGVRNFVALPSLPVCGV